jgi:hypothetical protein
MTYIHYIFKVIGGKSLLPLRPVSTVLEMLFQDQRGAMQLQSLVNYRRGQLREQERSKPLFRRPRPNSMVFFFFSVPQVRYTKLLHKYRVQLQ